MARGVCGVCAGCVGCVGCAGCEAMGEWAACGLKASGGVWMLL